MEAHSGGGALGSGCLKQIFLNDTNEIDIIYIDMFL